VARAVVVARAGSARAQLSMTASPGAEWWIGHAQQRMLAASDK
jgi:hypothetical protein